MTARRDASAAAEAEGPASGHRQNLASELVSADPAARREAAQRLPELVSEALKVAMSLLGNREDAEDAVADALSKWLRTRGEYGAELGHDEVALFKSVVRRSATNHLRSRIRQRLEHHSFSEFDETEQLLQRVRASIFSLPEPHQRVLHVYLTWDDASDPSRLSTRLGTVLGVPESTARARLTAALKALRQELAVQTETPRVHGGLVGKTSIDSLTAEFDFMLERMQTPEVRAGIHTGLSASPAELGQAALAAARRAG